MSLVIDASVALKWVLNEPDADRARALIGTDVLIAPDFLLLECANVLAIKARTGAVTREGAQFSLRALGGAALLLIPSAGHFEAAQSIAMDLGRSAYDSLYLAVARAEGAVLVTADVKFASAVLASPVHAGHLRLL